MKKWIYPAIMVVIGVLLVILSLFAGTFQRGRLEIQLVNTPLIMPAAHKVYSNPNALNGEYYLFKAKITNTSKSVVNNVTVKYRIPGFIEWTEINKISKIIPGQSVITVCYPVFNPSITELTTESMEKTEIVVDWDGAKERDRIEEVFGFKMLSRNDFAYSTIPQNEIAGWSDMYYNDRLMPCFVTPNDPIVKYYTQIIQEKIIRGESAGVGNDEKQALRFLMSIYEATRLSHMVYSGTKGIPQSLDDVKTLVQHVRLPREVITGNTGLCIELSVLYASILSNAGIDPLLFLVPGHVYPGFKMNGNMYAIEATGIGGEGLGNISSAEEALEQGMKQLEEFFKAVNAGDPRFNYIDVHQLNSMGVVSMNLPDNEYLRKRVDEIASKFEKMRTSSRYSSGSRQASNSSGGTSVSARFPGNPSFTIPAGWQTLYNPASAIPILTAQTVSPDHSITISVFDVPANSPQNAMVMVAQYFYQSGLNLQYSINGNHIQGSTISYNSTFNWIGKIAQVQGGYRFIAVGSDINYYNRNSGTINSIYNSIK